MTRLDPVTDSRSLDERKQLLRISLVFVFSAPFVQNGALYFCLKEGDPLTEHDLMREAINEAKKGLGYVDPNPLVGAVIVKNGCIISRGYHQRYGEFHAERNAILNSPEDVSGAEIYVTLEPCCHSGKTPPCTDIIIQSGIKKVYMGSDDPNPLVAGKGAEILRKSGIEVVTGVLKDECDRLNPVFFHYILNKTPYVVLKYAMTADGKTAAYTGRSKWISSESSRLDVQKLRLWCTGIMTGVETVIKDDPRLTCRLENGRDPVRIICDSNLRIPEDSYIVKTAKSIRTIIVCTEKADKKRADMLSSYGAEIVFTPEKDGRTDLVFLMQKLGEMKINSILLEGGSELSFSALKSGIVNRVISYISPKLLGGRNAFTPLGGKGFDDPENCPKLSRPYITLIENDIKAEWEVL